MLGAKQTGEELYTPAGSGNLEPRDLTIRNNKFNK